MSGEKCANIRISRSQYESLQRDTRRADNAERIAREVAERVQREAETQRSALKRQRTEMARKYSENVDNLRSDLRSSEQRQAQRLERLRTETMRSIEDLDADVDRRISEQSQLFNAALDEHRREMASDLQAVRTEIATDKARERAAAEDRVSDLETLCKLMQAQGRHARFAPGELETLQGKIALARADLAAGNNQAALAAAQERYFDYNELEMRILKSEAEWNAYLVAAQKQAAEVVGAVSAAEQAEYSFENKGDSVKVDAQVNFWSEGAIDTLKQRLREQKVLLDDPEQRSIEDLRNALEAMEPMQAELDEIIATARHRMLQSQTRQNIAASIVRSFEGTPWRLDDSTYEEEDLRRGVHVRFRNGIGEEVIASVTPVEAADGGITASVEINFFDSQNDEKLRAERLRQMTQEMQNEGVEVGDFNCARDSQNRPGNKQARDFERLRAKRSEVAGQ